MRSDICQIREARLSSPVNVEGAVLTQGIMSLRLSLHSVIVRTIGIIFLSHVKPAMRTYVIKAIDVGLSDAGSELAPATEIPRYVL